MHSEYINYKLRIYNTQTTFRYCQYVQELASYLFHLRRNQVMQMEARFSQLEADARRMKEAKEDRYRLV